MNELELTKRKVSISIPIEMLARFNKAMGKKEDETQTDVLLRCISEKAEGIVLTKEENDRIDEDIRKNFEKRMEKRYGYVPGWRS